MDKFSLVVLLSFASTVVAVVLFSVYQLAGTQWKRRPWIPLWMGIALLVSTFLLHWWLETASARQLEISKLFTQPKDAGARDILVSFSVAYMREARFVELAVIPLAMALIGIALTYRIENDHADKLRKIDDMTWRLEQLEVAAEKAENAWFDAVMASEEGATLQRLERRLNAAKKDYLDAFEDLRELQREAGVWVPTRKR